MKSVMQCGLNAIAEPFARSPEALERATQVYKVIDSTENAAGAFEFVYKKGLFAFSCEEQAEALLIPSGLDSCGEASPTAPEALALLLSGKPISVTDSSLLNKPADPNKQVSDSTKPRGDSGTPAGNSSPQNEKAAVEKAAKEENLDR